MARSVPGFIDGKEQSCTDRQLTTQIRPGGITGIDSRKVISISISQLGHVAQLWHPGEIAYYRELSYEPCLWSAIHDVLRFTPVIVLYEVILV